MRGIGPLAWCPFLMVDVMNKKRIRSFGFLCFLMGFVALILSVPIPPFFWLPGLWARRDNEFLSVFLLPCIGFGLVLISFALLALGSRRGQE